MRTFLLCSLIPLAAIGAAAPAAAFDPASSGIAPTPLASASSVRVHRGGGDFRRGDFSDRSDRRDRRRGRGDFVYYGDREYQGDTAWRSDSFNDWWHSRPDRNRPRWVAGNQNCERMWWSGGGWRC